MEISDLADELYAALGARKMVEPLTTRFPDLTLEDAYRVSRQLQMRRIEAGESLVGYKIGLTNKAVQDFFQIDQPDFGHLTDAMRFMGGSDVPITDRLIQPKIEGEIAFVLKRGLRGPGVTPDKVIDATDYVAPCFEIVDSRVCDWRIKIQDTVADNGSSGLFVMGHQRVDPRKLDLSACVMTMMMDGTVVSEGTGAAALGGPENAVAWLANSLGETDAGLQPGQVILSGALGPVVSATPGTLMKLSISDIGDASVRLL